jgi:hypothetical protein
VLLSILATLSFPHGLMLRVLYAVNEYNKKAHRKNDAILERMSFLALHFSASFESKSAPTKLVGIDNKTKSMIEHSDRSNMMLFLSCGLVGGWFDK